VKAGGFTSVPLNKRETSYAPGPGVGVESLSVGSVLDAI